MEIKETTISLSSEEVIELLGLCEDADKDKSLAFLKRLSKKVKKTQEGFRSSYQRGGHIGAAKLK